MNRSLTLFLSILALATGSLGSSYAMSETSDDPFLWLEEITSPRALAWVEDHNHRSLSTLEADPRFAGFYESARAIVEAQDKLAIPEFIGHEVYNFWQDSGHVRGVWRRTSLQSYQTSHPRWEVVLDLDALALEEGKNFVWKGVICRRPAQDRCIVQLSDGGKDAVEIREFDLVARRFVEGGFLLSQSKTSVDWLDDDTLILTRDFGPESLTESGYGYVIKTLKRGQTLDQSAEVYRGERTDVSAAPMVLRDGQGNRVVLLRRWLDYFHSTYQILDGTRRIPLNLPQQIDIEGLVSGRLVVQLNESWKGLAQGTLIGIDPEQALKTPDAIVPEVIYAPGDRQSTNEVAATRSRLIVAGYDNVRGRVMSFAWSGAAWVRKDIEVPENSGVTLLSTTSLDDHVLYASAASDQFLFMAASYLNPPTIYLAEGGTGRVKPLHSEPARFDSSGLVTEQREAVSKDGTRVPYFIVHRKDIKLDGKAPTLLYAYGGFQISMEPGYSPVTGKLWLERGGVYVVANIRGGGEFGPAWHQAGLKTHRQVIYDDFQAVALDLIGRKVTSPRHLGIMGGSNGGLLMGVQFNQRPDLWNAVVIQVPLLDMLRYDQLLAGASWVGEYGRPSDPVEGAFLRTISPYQNLKSGVAYPEPLIVTSTKDDRVHPGHARKFAARLEQLGLPFLYYENTDGGHAAAANQRERARRSSLEMTYLTRKLMD